MDERKKSKLVKLILAGVCVYFVYVFIGQQGTLNTINTKMESLDKEIHKEYAINEELNSKKQIINTDEYVEEVARKKLGYVKKGERVFVDVNK